MKLREIADRYEYQALLERAGRSDLLQSWAWGEAKAETENWRPCRYLVSDSDRPLALAQVLERRVGPLRLARINRGPTWIAADADPKAVLAALRAPWRWWTAGALLIAPNLPAGTAPAALGFRARSAPPWCSAWIDLQPAPEQLRKGLAGKWRNMLVNAEKAGLEVELRAGPAGIDWLMPRYADMLNEKGFSATPPALVQALGRHAGPEETLTVIVRKDGVDASAVLVVRHGGAATYLIGWNSDLGRNLRGNHLALWQAILALRTMGTRWFDLGGIDAVLTPGVAAFKRGLKGEEFTLAGEWLSL